MAVFAVSFRIADEGDAQKRRSSVVDQIQKEASGSTWDETTSFILIRSSKKADELASSIYLKSDMNGEWDKLLVVNLSSEEHATRGKIEYPTRLNNIMADR